MILDALKISSMLSFLKAHLLYEKESVGQLCLLITFIIENHHLSFHISARMKSFWFSLLNYIFSFIFLFIFHDLRNLLHKIYVFLYYFFKLYHKSNQDSEIFFTNSFVSVYFASRSFLLC